MKQRRQAASRIRGRVLCLVVGLLLFSLLVFGAVLAVASGREYRRELAGSLERAALAFRSSRARAFEQLSRQAELLASDSLFDQYREGLGLARPGTAEHAALRDALRQHLEQEFGTAGGDLLVLTGRDGRIDVVVRRAEEAPDGAGPVEPSEGTSGSEGAETPSPLKAGQDLSSPMVEAVYQDGSPRLGYLQPELTGPLYAAAVVPLKRRGAVDGVLVLGEKVGETTLADAVQGLNQGLMVVEADGVILAAHDRRSSKRPSPAILAALEQAIQKWAPPEGEEHFTAVEGEAAPIGELEVGGLRWLNLPVPLEGEQRAVAWALFLGDTSGLDEKVAREAWVLGQIGLVVLAMGLVLTWLLSAWVAAPASPGPEEAESPTP